MLHDTAIFNPHYTLGQRFYNSKDKDFLPAKNFLNGALRSFVIVGGMSAILLSY